MNIFIFKIVIFGDHVLVVSTAFNESAFTIFVLEFAFRIFFLGMLGCAPPPRNIHTQITDCGI